MQFLNNSKRRFRNTSLITLGVLAFGVLFSGPSRADSTLTLDVFVGEWEGTATAYFPRLEDRENRNETITVSSTKALQGTYVQCDSRWISDSGNVRDLLIFWNYDKQADKYEILFLYDNWPGKVNYKLDYDSTKREFVGSDTFTGRGGVPAQEKVRWIVSADGNEIRSIETNHYETDPEDYWPVSFEFVWRRVVQE